jgi:hypothetical protein
MNFEEMNKSSFIEVVGGVIVRVGTDDNIKEFFTDPDGVTHQAVVSFNPVTGTLFLTFFAPQTGMSAYDIVLGRCGAAQGSSVSASSQSDRRMGLTQISAILWAYKRAQEEALPLKLQEMGWRKFVFLSRCDGTKVELEGDENRTFLFHPEIDITRWEGVEFSHMTLHRSREAVEFSEWLDTLEEGEDYIEL